MQISKRLTCIFLLLFPFLSYAQTGTLNGMVKDENNQNVRNAKVSIRSTGQSSLTDSSGTYSISGVSFGTHELEVTGENIAGNNFVVNVNQAITTADLAVTDRVNEAARAAVDNIPVISVSDDDLREGSSAGVSSVLSASRDAFTSATSFVFSAARFRIRGYDDDNFLTLMNGVPMNDIVSGRNLYSSFSGLNDVVRSREYSNGLAPATYSYGAIGGVYHIDSRASRQRKQLSASYALSNRSYDNRLMVTYGSGINHKGWSYSLSYSRRWAQEGFVAGTFYDGHSYFGSLEKQINNNHSLSLTAFGASTKNGRSGPAVREMFDLSGTHYYNPNWGYQNGEKRNASVAHGHQPMMILTHDWKINDKSSLISAASFQTGKYKVSGLDWFNAEDPRPDYYRRLPSFDPYYGENPEGFAALSAQVENLLRNNEELRQIQWDRLYEANQLHDTTFNGVKGKMAKYVVSDRIIDNRRINFNTIYNTLLNDNLTLNAGLTYQTESSNFYKEVQDLMGADFYVDLNQYADLSNVGNPDVIQNDLNNPNRVLREGDRYGYDYTAHASKAAVWGQGVLRFDRMDYFMSLQLSSTTFYREGHVKNGVYPLESFGKSDKENFFNYAIKGGATYKYNGRNYFFANGTYLTRAPLFENAYISPRTRNKVANDLDSETIYGVEGGYLLKAPRLKARAVAYYTQYQDIVDNRSFYHGDFRTFVNYTLTNIDKRHAGFELAVEANLGKGFSASAVAAIGEYVYTDRPLATITQDNRDTVLASNDVVYAKNLHVANGPESAYTFGLTYRSPKFWSVYLNLNYFDKRYVDFNPSRRTISSLDLVNEGSTTWNQILSQEKIDGQFTVDISGSKSWRMNNHIKSLKKNTFLVLNIGISNILNNEDIITTAFEQLRFDAGTKDINRFPAKYAYGFGTTFFASLTLRMN